MANPPERKSTWWTPFTMGSIVGAVPWIVITVYLVGSDSAVPNFVYGIFVFFNCFAVNQWLQYRGKGRWGDYLFGERVYIWLSLAGIRQYSRRLSDTGGPDADAPLREIMPPHSDCFVGDLRKQMYRPIAQQLRRLKSS